MIFLPYVTGISLKACSCIAKSPDEFKKNSHLLCALKYVFAELFHNSLVKIDSHNATFHRCNNNYFLLIIIIRNETFYAMVHKQLSCHLHS